MAETSDDSKIRIFDKEQIRDLAFEMIVIAFLAGSFASGGELLLTTMVTIAIFLALLILLTLYDLVRKLLQKK